MMRTTIALALLLASTASAARAQEPGSPKEVIGTGLLRAMYATVPLVHAADGISTMRVVTLGGRELNPLVAMQTERPAVFAATKAGIVAAEIFLAHRLAKRHKWGAIAALAALNVGYGMVAAHNFRVARTLQGQRAGLR